MADFINTIDVLGDEAVMDSIIDRSITEFKSNVLTEVGRFAFYDCTSLEAVDLPNVTNIGESAFQNCTALKTFNFVNTTTLGNKSFGGCSSLTEICCPLVTGTIYYTFMDCKNLKSADFSALNGIGGEVFIRANALDALIIRTATICTLANAWSLHSTPIAAGTGYIYVPKSLIDNYKAASNWSTYAAQFRALEDYTVDGTTTGALDETKI